MTKGTDRLVKSAKQFADTQYKFLTRRYGQQMIDIFEFPIRLVLSPFTLAFDIAGSAQRGFGVPEFISKLSYSAIFVVATFGTYDIALELGKKVLCQRNCRTCNGWRALQCTMCKGSGRVQYQVKNYTLKSGEKATADAIANAIAEDRAELVHLPSTMDLHLPLPSKDCPSCDATGVMGCPECKGKLQIRISADDIMEPPWKAYNIMKKMDYPYEHIVHSMKDPSIAAFWLITMPQIMGGFDFDDDVKQKIWWEYKESMRYDQVRDLVAKRKPGWEYLQEDLTWKKIFGKRHERDDLYYFVAPSSSGMQATSLSVSINFVLPTSNNYVFSLKTLDLWHARLGHANFQYLCWLFSPLNKVCKDFHFHCVVCELSKHTRTSYILRMHKVPSAFDLIHSDVWGPSPVTALSHHRYYVTFIDDYTRCTWTYLMKKKSKVFSYFRNFLQMIKTQFHTVVRNIRSYNGREYITNDFRAALNKEGILQQLTCPYTPEQNGVAERKNRHIMSVVRCLLCGMNVPKYFWHIAVLTATYLINHTPSRVLEGKTPLHCLKPDVTLFPILPHVFGCTCFVQNRSPTRTKLDDKAVCCVFLGDSSMSKGYRCYDPVSRHLYHSLDVTFLETVTFFPGSSPSAGQAPVEPVVADESILPRPVPILDSTGDSLPPVITSDPSQALVSIDPDRAKDDPVVVKNVPFYKAKKSLEAEVMKLDPPPRPQNWGELNLPLNASSWSEEDLKDPQKLYEMTVLLNAQREIADNILDTQWDTKWRQEKLNQMLEEKVQPYIQNIDNSVLPQPIVLQSQNNQDQKRKTRQRRWWFF